MTKPKYPSEKLDQYMLRLPDGMRDRIKAAADANGRSMNSEIIALLEENYPAPEWDFGELYTRCQELFEEMREIVLSYRQVASQGEIDDLDKRYEELRAEQNVILAKMDGSWSGNEQS